jgi:hypothetical protein
MLMNVEHREQDASKFIHLTTFICRSSSSVKFKTMCDVTHARRPLHPLAGTDPAPHPRAHGVAHTATDHDPKPAPHLPPDLGPYHIPYGHSQHGPHTHPLGLPDHGPHVHPYRLPVPRPNDRPHGRPYSHSDDAADP